MSYLVSSCLHVFCLYFCCWVLCLLHCGQIVCTVLFLFSYICWGLLCALGYWLTWKGLFGAHRANLHFETLKLQEVLIWKPKTILTGNNMLEAASSNMHDFHLRDPCISSAQLNLPSWRKQNLSSTWKLCIAGRIPLKTNSIISGQQCSTCSCFKYTWFSIEKYLCSFNLDE
jgi:hypothetical protein